MKKRFFATALALLLGVCALGFTGCKGGEEEGDITVYMPDGAPALAFALLMSQDTEGDGVSYRVVDPTLIASKVSYKNMDENADLCVLPLTVATATVGTGEKYQMLGAVTHGNLYIISKDNSVQFTAENLASLQGKTVGVLQLSSTPGLIFKTVLTKHGVPFNDLSGGGEAAADKVNLRLLPSPKDMGTMIEAGVDYFVLAEPAVTAQKSGGFYSVGDLQTLYGGVSGYPQAVLVAKKSLIEEKDEWVRAFVEDVTRSAAWARTANGSDIVSAVTLHLEDSSYSTTLKAPLLTVVTLERCGLGFEVASACKDRATAFLQTAYSIDGKVVLPSEDFYCRGL